MLSKLNVFAAILVSSLALAAPAYSQNGAGYYKNKASNFYNATSTQRVIKYTQPIRQVNSNYGIGRLITNPSVFGGVGAVIGLGGHYYQGGKATIDSGVALDKMYRDRYYGRNPWGW